MPSSFVDSFAPIVKTLIDLAPRRVVDIGPGWGKYGLACREYLPSLTALHCIEVQEGRLGLQEYLYDDCFTMDVRRIQPKVWLEYAYDVALFIDVIEHMTKPEAHAVLRDILAAGTQVLMATPKQFFEQHDDHNPFETHVSHWTWEDFKDFYIISADVSTIDAIIYVLTKR